MKIIGTTKEICWIADLLKDKLTYREIPLDVYKQLSGKSNGLDISFEIQEKPTVVGIVAPSSNSLISVVGIAEKHGGRLFAIGGIPNSVNTYSCKDGATIHLHNSFNHLRGFKLDELWMDTLPSDWDEFDLCMSSVGGDRSKIHFFKELEG